MNEASEVITTTVSAPYWQETVQYYTQLFGEPKQQSDSEALFSSAEDDLTLRLTKDQEQTEKLQRPAPRYYIVPGPDGANRVRRLYKYILRTDNTAYGIQEPIEIDYSGKGSITIAFIGHGDPCGILESQTDCLIHNPNWGA